jgi:hypothetical protein
MTRQKKDVLYMLGYELVHIALQRDMRYERSVQDVLNERAPNDNQYRSVCTANHFEGNGSNWGGDARLKG